MTRRKAKSIFDAFSKSKGKKSLFNAFDGKSRKSRKSSSLFNAFGSRKGRAQKGKSLFNAFGGKGRKQKKSLFTAFDKRTKGMKMSDIGSGLLSGWGDGIGGVWDWMFGNQRGNAMENRSYTNAIHQHDMRDNPASLLYYAMRLDREEDVQALINDVKRTKGNQVGLPISVLDFRKTDQVLETWRKYKLNPDFKSLEARIRTSTSEPDRWALVNTITDGNYRSVPGGVYQYLSTLASPSTNSKDTTDLV